jgi:hypothetical protein
LKAATGFGFLAIAALVVAAPIATGASRPDNESARVRLVVTQPDSVDNDPSGNSGGDLVGSFGEIHRLGKEIGDYDGACTLASPVIGQYQATLSWSERGTLQLAGNLRLDQQ